MVTMANIDVVTDYLQQEEFLMEDRGSPSRND